MKKRKIFYCVILLFFIFCVKNRSLAKYEFVENIIIADINIDKTKPKLVIQYQPLESNENKVMVKIEANEQIKKVDSWSISQDEKSIEKIYPIGAEENIQVQDIAGNISIAKIIV